LNELKTILIFVSTLDGKVTKWGAPNVKLWSSHEDQDYYKKIWNDSHLIIMGSNSFKAEKGQSSSDHRLIVLTRHPETYKSLEIPGQLEFTNEPPAELASRFQNEGYEQMLVVGGPHVATSFLKEQLIDELWLTIEPKIFGVGDNFAMEEKLNISLHLLHCEKVNEEGTLITKYAVLKN